MIAEYNKAKGDYIITGKDIGGVEYNLAGAFILYRGVLMMDDWINTYKYNTWR